MNIPTTTAHDDGLEWLREIRRKHMQEAGGDLRRLGDRYRTVQARHPEKVIQPRQMLAAAVRGLSGK